MLQHLFKWNQGVYIDTAAFSPNSTQIHSQAPWITGEPYLFTDGGLSFPTHCEQLVRDPQPLAASSGSLPSRSLQNTAA